MDQYAVCKQTFRMDGSSIGDQYSVNLCVQTQPGWTMNDQYTADSKVSLHSRSSINFFFTFNLSNSTKYFASFEFRSLS